jgi:hypothetical protein
LEVCSDFPLLLQKHLSENNSTLDKLAGVFPTGRFRYVWKEKSVS